MPQVPGVTTYLHGALIGMEVRINTSAWPGYTDRGNNSERKRSDCVQPLTQYALSVHTVDPTVLHGVSVSMHMLERENHTNQRVGLVIQ